MTALRFSLDQKMLNEYGLVVFTGTSTAEPHVKLRVVYPDAFPSMQPSIYTVGDLLLKGHHRPDTHELCAFGFAANTRWSATQDGVDAVAEAETILQLDEANASDQPHDTGPPEPVTDVLGYEDEFVVLVPENLIEVGPQTAGTVIMYIRPQDNLLPLRQQIVISEVMLHNRPSHSAQVEFQPWINGKRVTATFFQIHSTPRTQQEVLDQLFTQGVNRRRRANEVQWFFLIFPEPGDQGTTLAWVLIRLHAGQAKLYRCFPFSRSAGAARVPGLERLQVRSVMIVGAGALGSQVASNLAQAGMGKIYLLDQDHLSPGNLVRYAGDLDGVGQPKVNAVARRLRHVNPFVQVIAQNVRVGAFGGRDAEAAFYDSLRSVDLLIEATGIHSVRRYLNELAYPAGVQAIYGWVTNGIWGCESVRVLPKETPCYLCFRDTKTCSAPSSPTNLIFPVGCAQPTFTGTGFDVAEAAAIMTRLSIQTLLRGENSYPDISGHHVVWTNRDSAGGVAPSWSVSSFTKVPRCYVCG